MQQWERLKVSGVSALVKQQQRKTASLGLMTYQRISLHVNLISIGPALHFHPTVLDVSLNINHKLSVFYGCMVLSSCSALVLQKVETYDLLLTGRRSSAAL